MRDRDRGERRRDRDDDERRPSRRDREERSSGKRGKSKFQYHRRESSTYTEQANQKGGNWDRTYKSQYKVFKVEAGKSYQIRILPPTWEDPQHFAYDRWQHSGVGDRQRYNCLQKHKNENCPVCEESIELRNESRQADDPKEAKALADASYKASCKLRKVMWVIDRDNEKEGPQIWDPSWTVNRDLAGRCVNERTGAILHIDDPDDGYDVTFKGEKKGPYVEIISIEVARQSTPLSDDQDQQDEWLEYAQENPIPETFFFYDYDHINKVMSGGSVKREDEEDDKDSPRTRSERKRGREDEDEDESRSSRRSLRDEEDDEDLDDDDPKGRSRRHREEEDDDEDDRPRSHKRSRDDDEDVEEDEDDEDDRPRSRRQRDDDDDDDEEGGSHGKVRKVRKHSAPDEELEGDDDEPSSRRNSDRDERSDRGEGRRSGKGRSRSEDDEDGREDRPVRREVKRRRDDDDDLD